MRKQIITSLCMVGMIAALAGCGGPVQIQETTAKIACGQTSTGDSLCSYRVPIGETRHVTCVAVGGGGITCDWAHADGADKGWSQ